MKMKIQLKAIDILIITTAVAVTVFSAVRIYAVPPGEARAMIKGQGREWVFPIDAEETLTVPGPLGDTIVKISGNGIRIEQSPCVNKTCVAQGIVSKHGSWAACLPNGVFISVEGREASGDEPDAFAW